jgi:hypothetical protein
MGFISADDTESAVWSVGEPLENAAPPAVAAFDGRAQPVVGHRVTANTPSSNCPMAPACVAWHRRNDRLRRHG